VAKQRKGRMLRENCLESKKLATATHAACNLWFRLLVKVDDYGNFPDDPAMIKTACFLWRPGMRTNYVKELLDELHAIGLLSRYEVDGERFIHLERFEDFQELRYEKVARFPRQIVLPVATCPPTLPPENFPVASTPPTPPAKSNADNKSGDEVKKKRSEGAACPVWKETGVDPKRVPGPFRKVAEDAWPTRDGSSIFKFMGEVLDIWKALGARGYPQAWVQRKLALAHLPAKSQPERPELEAIPWKKR